MSTEYKTDLSKVSILLKTIGRDLHLYDAITGIVKILPECRMIVVDDGDMTEQKRRVYAQLRENGHMAVELPWDSGFGKKSNIGAAACATDYLLIGSDDFNFHQPSVRAGIQKLVAVLDGDQNVHVASGRVNNVCYEGWLLDEGKRVTERYINLSSKPMSVNGTDYFMCNLTVNYSLCRASMFGSGKIEWDDDIKIGGGEHGAQFVKILRAGLGVAYVPGVHVQEQQGKPTDPRYPGLRARASQQTGRPAFKKIGVEEYMLFSGTVEKA